MGSKCSLLLVLLVGICLCVHPAIGAGNPPITGAFPNNSTEVGVPAAPPVTGEYREGEVIVGFKPISTRNYRAADSPAMRAHARLGARVKKDFTAAGLEGVQVVALPPNQTVASAVAMYNADPAVHYAEPNYLVRADQVPNDPSFAYQWGLRNTGQSVAGQYGTAGADIDAARAWDVTTGSSSIVIAVIDTGIDYTHPDLTSNIWMNPGEIAGNGRDDDGNGLVDDVRGWDFCNNDNSPMDDEGHGTHCAGVVGATGNNGVGVAGVMHRVRLMPLKFLDSMGMGDTSDEIDCILYARSKGARVISCSFGSEYYSYWEEEAITATNALFVCAAGNDGSNNDGTPHYPSGFTAENILAVASTDNRDQLVSTSNYGAASVDLAAPGRNIYSTMPGNSYAYLSGTSMATPHVAGVAGLVLGREPALSLVQLKARILGGVDRVSSLQGRTVTGGRLNAYRALGGDTANFDCSPRSGIAPLAVQFTDTSSGTPSSWYWSFGDGGTSSSRNPSHTYTAAGTYDVTLTVSYPSGSSTKTKPAWVSVAQPAVVTLPAVITKPGTYTINRDYQNLAGAIAIDIRCSDVVIDGGGHLVDGVDTAKSAGVQVHGSTPLSGVTVRNLRVTDWAQGIYYWDARGRIEGVTASSNTGAGIMVYVGGDGTTISGCTAENNGIGGISVSYAPGAEIASCTARNNVNDGVYLYSSSDAQITGSTSTGNSMSGIALLGSSTARIRGVSVSDCVVTANGKTGIYMTRAEANTVANNRIGNTRNTLFEGEVGANAWNTQKTAGTNIIGGPYLGGNWWSGFSETAVDADRDGFADQPNVIASGNSDALPLVPQGQNDFVIRPGTVITAPGTYSLNQDIQDLAHPIVVEIRCSNVVIDGKGHRISGDGREGWCGIYASSPTGPLSGITIRDLTVSNIHYGIYLSNTDASRIERCRIDGTPSNGMGLILHQGSDGNTVTGNRILAGSSSGSGTMGVVVVSSSQNVIANNEFNNPVNAYIGGTIGSNTWNGARTAGTNIIGGSYLGGNYWAEPDGTGWSQQAADTNYDGIGDSPYALATGNTDAYPLVKPRPVASFTAAPTIGTAPLSVQFTDTSTGSPTSWSWSFGDGYTSTSRNPVHTYYADGTYTVSLTVSNAAGSTTTTRAGMITVSAPLSVESIVPSAGTQGSTVEIPTLAGTGFQSGATVMLTRYGYGDIAATSVVVVSPTKITCRLPLPSTAATGLWTVVATNPNGMRAMLLDGFEIAPALAVSSITPSTGSQGSTVAITNLAGTGFGTGATVKLQRSGSADIPATSVYVASSTRISCQFPLPSTAATGAWNVVVTNPGGGSATLTGGFVVTQQAPTAGFTATPTSGTAPLSVQFSDASSGSPTSWSWSFGDGYTSTSRNPAHTYTAAGTYTVSLTVWNAAGQSDTEMKANLVSVGTVPPAVASITPNTGTRGSTVAITDLAGTGFQNGATVKLTRSGSSDLAATNVVMVSSTKITCQVAVPSTAATGAWNVVVTNPNGLSGTLPNGFTVATLPQVTLSTGTYQVPNAGGTVSVPIVLSSAPGGLSGYRITVSLSDPSIATITSVAFPDWAGLKSSSALPSGQVVLQGIDLSQQVPVGGTNVILATLTMRGSAEGSTSIVITLDPSIGVQDRNGDLVPAATTPGMLTVAHRPYFDCIQSAPTDPNGDGKYEDVNGNGRADFADIVTLFNNLDCIAADDDWQCLDCNGNGRIDFADVTWLFNSL